MKTEKMIGLSLSLCIRDIMAGIYSIHDVVKIVTGTRICTMDDFDHVCHDERGYGAHYWQADPAAGRRIFMNLLLLGKIDQPRTRGEDTPNLQNGHWINTKEVNVEKLFGKATADWMQKHQI